MLERDDYCLKAQCGLDVWHVPMTIKANRPDEWKKLKAPVAYDLKGRPLGELFSDVCKAYLEATKK